MRLRKAVTLALGLCLGLGGLGLAARAAHAPIAMEGHGVWGVYQGPEMQRPQYTVDMTWGTMEFLPVETLEMQPDDQSGEYVSQIQDCWISQGNEVQVCNQSQQPLSVSFSFTSWQDGVKGAFSQAAFSLPAQEEQVSTLSLEGEGESSLEYSHIGEITVTIQTP